MSFCSDVSAGVSVLLVSAGRLDFFDGSMFRRSALVEAIVDVDLVDMASFSVSVLVLMLS